MVRQSATATTTGERGFWRIIRPILATNRRPGARCRAVSDESWFDTARGYYAGAYLAATGQEVSVCHAHSLS